MNEMELLRQVAQETPLPAPGELDAARARLVAAIATDPATHATAVAEVTVDQASPSTGQPAGLLRPPAPRPVLTAVKLMYGGAAGSAATVIIALLYAFSGHIKSQEWFGHHLTAAQASHWPWILLIIALVMAYALPLIALWLWMARAVGRGRNWARISSTVLAALAALQLSGNHGVAWVFCAWLTWLTGLAAVCLLWLPASSAFFRPQFFAQAQRMAQTAELARIRSSSARWVRQV
jgi:hypothetical protein